MIGRDCGEPCFAQFMNALAQHALTGTENLDEVLRRVAQAQRAQTELQQRIVSAQAEARMLTWIYAVAPLAFMALMRLVGGQFYADFYGTLVDYTVDLGLLDDCRSRCGVVHAVNRHSNDQPESHAGFCFAVTGSLGATRCGAERSR